MCGGGGGGRVVFHNAFSASRQRTVPYLNFPCGSFCFAVLSVSKRNEIRFVQFWR